MTETFKLRYVNQIVGIVVLLFLVAMLIFMLFLLHQKQVFTERFDYNLQIEQTQLGGLRPGMDVRILGETAGTINRVEYADANSSEISLGFQIKNLDKYAVLENSRVIVARSFGVGEPYLEIQRGRDVVGLIVTNLTASEAAAANVTGVRVLSVLENSPANGVINENDIIHSVDEVDISGVRKFYERTSQVEPGDDVQFGVIRSGVPSTIESIRAADVDHERLPPGSTIYQFQPDEDKLQSLATDVSKAGEAIRKVENTFTTRVDEKFVPSMESFGTASDKIGKAFEGLNPKFNNSLDGLDQATDQIFSGIERITQTFDETIDPTFNDLRKTINEIRPKTSSALDNINEAVTDLKNSADSTLSSAQAAIDDIAPQTTSAISQIESAAASLQRTIDRARPILNSIKSESDQLPGTVARVNQAVDSVDRVMKSTQRVADGVSEHWLIRRAVKRSERRKQGGGYFRGR